MTTKVKQGGNPTAGEMNALAALFNQGKLAEAEKLAMKITARHPKLGFGWKVLGAIYQSQGRVDEALDVLKKAAEFLPDDYEAQYNLGNCFYDRQQLDSAAVCYQKAIQLNPGFAPAHYNLGNVFKNQDLLEDAENCYKEALRIDAGNVNIFSNLAHVLFEQNKLNDAKACYEQALAIQEDFYPAHAGLGAVLKALNLPTEAEGHYRKALKINPHAIDALNNLGDLLKDSGRFSEAEACYTEALALMPDSADSYLKQGILLRTTGRVRESVHYFTEALYIEPLRKDIHNDLGLAMAELGLLQDAESCYQKALEIDSEYWVTHNNLGLTLHGMGRFAEAESAFNKAIELNPAQALLYSNLSLPLTAQGKILSAGAVLKKAIQISPEYVNAHINLCTNYLAQGLAKEAEEACFEALRLQPDSTKAKSNLLFTMNYSGHHNAEYRLEQAIEFDRIVSGKTDKVFTSWQHQSGENRLRIGLVSGDMRQHPVAYFLENWAKNVDFSKFELIAYLTDSREDTFTGRLKPNFSEWKSLVGMSDQAAAELIHDDAIDILLDLSGHTSGNRLQIFAWKPAPVQASWIGYFATTGMKSIDYFLADEVGVPIADRTHFVEQIKYLPDTRLCFTAPDSLIEVSPLPALANGYITFASFQTLVKAGDDVLALWAQVMRAIPGSRLRWQCKSLGDADVAAEVMQRLVKLGIDSERITLLGSVSRDAYLAAHAEVDVILDTFPYPGGTTTCEALWMGVPTLTLAGDTLIARQGASLLTAAGLGNWVAESKADYVNKALLLCNDLYQLASLRAKLRAQVLASPLFDAERFARNMEIALWEMWAAYQNGFGMPPNGLSTPEALVELNADSDDSQLQHHDHVIIVSATRYSERDFWNKSALGLSLPRHLGRDRRLSIYIVFENSRGLSEIFNEAVDAVEDKSVLVFIHDDVWIDEVNFVDTVLAGLAQFDVVGVVGNKRRLPNQPAWPFVDTRFTWDEPENLSGSLAHGEQAFGSDRLYGEVPAECELLDGVFLAVKKSTFMTASLAFDPQFDFYFYDMDFCRSARRIGLRLGTWPVSLTHQSDGAYGSPAWVEKYQCYLNKWEGAAARNHALAEAVNEVLQMAIEHQQAGRIEQAELLYQEIIKIQPDHAEANHNSGVIEAQLNGVLAALPWFEKAVQAAPEKEQYWVSYIDALMQSGAIDTVADALELGQKFGLRPEVAQMLAADFVSQIDARVERRQASQALALEALQVVLEPGERHPSSPRHAQWQGKPVFYIWSPNYTDCSSGIKALHLLCDRLNGLGYEAYITATKVNHRLRTPQATTDLIHHHKQEGRLQIAIYPETQMGNPLLVPNVVRYLLNKPNFFVKGSWFGAFHKDERVLHYDSIFAVPWIKSACVRVQTVDRDIFKLPNDNQNRSGFLVYSHRVKPDLKLIPEWCKPLQVISMDKPRSAADLAKLYQASAGLIVFERTAAIIEAIFCGCPVIASSVYGFRDFSIYDDVLDIAWDFDLEVYEHAKQSILSFPDVYDANEETDTRALVSAIDDIIFHFQSGELDAYEITPTYAPAYAKKLKEAGQIKEAVITYRQLMLDFPDNVETYFRFASELVELGLFKPALDVLLQGESYLEALPAHDCLDTARFVYYELLSAASKANGDLVQSDQYVRKGMQYQKDFPVNDRKQ